MDSFSMGGAWSFGFRFFDHRRAIQLMILIGIGVVLPLLVQFAFAGGATGQSGLSSPAMLGVGGPRGTPTAGTLLSYFLQLAAYFVTWRLGFAPGRSAGGALLYGLLASLVAAGAMALIVAPALWGAQAAMASGVPFMGLLVALIPLLAVVAIFYTLPAVIVGTIAAILLVASMVLGAVTGNVGLAATLIGGGSGAVVVLFLVLSVIWIWLATRLSCTTCVMADWKTFNLVAAIRESWRLTLEDQWLIMRYLLMIAFALGVLIIGAAIVAGIGAAAYLQGGSGPAGPIAAVGLGLVFGVPIALLTVLLPAGIYRELTRSSLAAEVFA